MSPTRSRQLLLCALALALAAPASAVASTCSVPMQKHSPWNPVDTSDGTYTHELAQSFTPSVTHELCRVGVVIGTAVADVPQTVTLKLQDGPTSAADTVYAQATVTGVDADGWYYFDMPDVTLSAGQEYFLFLSYSDGGDIIWRRNNPGGDEYVSGQAYLDGVGLDTEIAYTDWWFETYTYEGIPTLSEWGLMLLAVILLTLGSVILVRRRMLTRAS